MKLPKNIGPIKGLHAQCEDCAGTSFGRSHLQLKDVLLPFQFRYPVRCLSCGKRQGVNLLVAWRAVPSNVKRVRTSREEARWSGWNASDREVSGGTLTEANGRNFSALPVRAPISMPNLKGVTLKHVADATASDKTAAQQAAEASHSTTRSES